MEKWTSEKKDRLIELWRNAQALYNKKDPNYNDYSYHQKLLERIAKCVKMPCKLSIFSLIQSMQYSPDNLTLANSHNPDYLYNFVHLCYLIP